MRFSVKKFYNSLKSQGVACTKNNLYSYMDHLTDNFLFYQVPIHSRSERIRRVNPKKVYVIDPELLEAMSLHIRDDRGALLENLVFMHFFRQGLVTEYYVKKGGGEVDFVPAAEDRSERWLIQVCVDIHDPVTQKREVNALLSAMQELGISRGTIVTWLDEDVSDKRLNIVPTWKWLLTE
jgi:predicted AAA+ superfamily ATPase